MDDTIDYDKEIEKVENELANLTGDDYETKDKIAQLQGRLTELKIGKWLSST